MILFCVTVGQSDASSIRYMLLNPAIYFSQVLCEARSVVIAGGTMQPITEFKEQLLLADGMSPSRIVEFSCGKIGNPIQTI